MTKAGSRRTTSDSVAPCGMNCSLCRAYGRERKPCPGCRADAGKKTKTRQQCGIRNCEEFADGAIHYCFSCSDFPCKSLRHLDSRYKAKYGMSMIENLAGISKTGIEAFVETENKRWACHRCGEIVCVHKPECCSCGQVRAEEPKNPRILK